MRDWQDDGAPTFRTLKSATHTSTADRLCDVCGKIICKGSLYRRDVYLEDGAFVNVAAHVSWQFCDSAEWPPDPYDVSAPSTASRSPSPSLRQGEDLRVGELPG